MKLSFIFELLLVFVLIAFAASAAVGKSNLQQYKKGVTLKKNGKIGNIRQESSANRYCSCSTKLCNCCREFNVPIVALKGPGCATLQYLNGDKLALSMSFGERVLTNTTLAGRRPDPICMPLPGGVSKFCGRVYNIGRKGENFNACLGLELRSANDIEASMRVSCFRFGPQGLKLEPPQPLPVVEEEEDEDDDDDDDDEDDDDDFDFDDDDEDDDDDDSENDVDSEDYQTFSVLDDDFIGGYFQGGESSSNKKRRTTTTTKAPLRQKYTRKPVTPKPLKKKVVTQKQKPASNVKASTSKIASTTSLPIISTMVINDTITSSEENITKLIIENDNATQTFDNSNITDTNESSYSSITTLSTDMPLDTTTVTTLSNQINESTTQLANNQEEEEEDDDPLAEAVEEAIGDSSDEESSESSDESTELNKNATVVTKSQNTTPKNTEKESKDVLDDIADGVAETFDDDDDDDNEEDDSEDDDDDDDDLFRSLKSTSLIEKH